MCRHPPFPTGQCSLIDRGVRAFFDDVYNTSRPLSPCTVYNYSVHADAAGSSRASKPRLLAVPGEAPPVRDILVTGTSSSSVQIKWKVPSTGPCFVMGYTVQQLPSNNTIQDCCSPLQTELVVESLSPYKQYSFSVQAETFYPGPKRKAVSYASGWTKEGRPGPVTGLDVTVSGGFVTVIWQPPLTLNGLITKYVVRQSHGAVHTFSVHDQLRLRLALSGFRRGQREAFFVSAFNGAGRSSEVSSAVEIPEAVPPPCPNVYLTPTGHTTAVVSWLPPFYSGHLTGFNVSVHGAVGKLCASLCCSQCFCPLGCVV